MKTSLRTLHLTFLLSIVLSAGVQLHAQDYQITFAVLGGEGTPDSVTVENLDQQIEKILNGTDVLHLVKTITGIENISSENNALRVFPNPMAETAIIEFHNPQAGQVCIEAYDFTGKKIAHQANNLPEGTSSYSISGLNTGTYVVNLITEHYKSSAEIISTITTGAKPTIALQSAQSSMEGSTLKSAAMPASIIEMQYNDGENLRFTATLNGSSSEQELIPTSSQTISFGFNTGTVSDYDGNTYTTIKIGDQWWMAENLKTTHYADGTAIPLVESTSGWDYLGYTDKAYCYYDNSSGNGNTYGALYTWEAARNACPSGWHLPEDTEWKELEMYLGMSQSEADATGYRGTNEGSKLAGNANLWNNSYNLENNAGFGNSGFTALPGGYRGYDGAFGILGSGAYFWSATERSSSHAWARDLNDGGSEVGRGYGYKHFGFSARCTKD